jgi:hypothetical protein
MARQAACYPLPVAPQLVSARAPVVAAAAEAPPGTGARRGKRPSRWCQGPPPPAAGP